MLKRGRFALSYLVLFLFVGYGCQSRHGNGLYALQSADPSLCREIDHRIDFQNRIETLNLIAQAYYNRCYEKVIQYGPQAQSAYRQKTFSIVRETGNLFFPDGILIDYVLESHERAFFSFLLAASYAQLGQTEAAKVELRRLDHELMTRLYNFGEDPVNILLQAVLWERLGEVPESRVDWNRLHGQANIDESVRAFAVGRMESIDRREALRSEWKIYAVDFFPKVEWQVKWADTTGGYFDVKPASRFLEACASDTGVRLSTESWFDKIAGRYHHDYHPLLNLQSWVRLPIGLVYGATTFAFGTGIAVGGCLLDGMLKGSGQFCEGSVRTGFEVIKESPGVVRKTIEPDLRHWENVPAAILATTVEEPALERCLTGIWMEGTGRVRRIF
ncbi:hypothetical protein [Candidatus Manganitrophus noduliformans]|uniref:Lipoprotein n=1 Tax=Candidatus Manganitrophus noduliformans TaxID=2606439 RepID=A0A7X6DP93_9BACT|nr:hypothetical protein [Candidatus Manganitrophus noduliformans]NKE70787.1 hypothetical protein [Candidatus Manganitrophus noduliformans]